MRPRLALRLVSLLVLGLSVGCSHTLTVQNYPDADFRGSAPSSPLVVGLVDQGGGEHSDEYVEAIAQGLQIQPGVERVVFPYTSGAQVDAVAQVDVNPVYEGSGLNFLINWPGFLVFAPAWNGYIYHADPETRVQILSADGEAVHTVDWDHEYEFHQSDIGRTWTQLGWLEYGVTPLIGGLVFIQYDTDQTPHFIDEVSDNYGRQVAQKIAHALAVLEPYEETEEGVAKEPAAEERGSGSSL